MSGFLKKNAVFSFEYLWAICNFAFAKMKYAHPFCAL
jgi:hypothetical protein